MARCLKYEVNRLGLQRKGEKVTREFLDADDDSCEVCIEQHRIHTFNFGFDEHVAGYPHSDQSADLTNINSNSNTGLSRKSEDSEACNIHTPSTPGSKCPTRKVPSHGPTCKRFSPCVED